MAQAILIFHRERPGGGGLVRTKQSKRGSLFLHSDVTKEDTHPCGHDIVVLHPTEHASQTTLTRHTDIPAHFVSSSAHPHGR